MELAASIFGYLGIASTLLISMQKKRDNLLLWKFLCDVFWLTHYILIHASSAVAATVTALLRTWVFMNSRHSWARGRRWLYIFLGAALVFAAIGWEGPVSIFMLLGSLASVLAYWCDTPKKTRLLIMPACVFFLIYYIRIGSMQPIVCEVFLLISSIIGFLRYDLKKAP